MDKILQSLTDNLVISTVGGVMIVLLAGITCFLANKNIAVFNDGVRPLVGQKKQGNLKYRALAGMSFGMSIGYVIGFIPFSIASNILIMHTVLLGSEMIGLLFKNDKKFSILATLLAMGYGAAIYWGLNGLGEGIKASTYPGFGWDLGQIVDGAFPFIFSMFPAVALFLQSGWKKGSVAVILSVLTYILIALYGWKEANLYPMAITLLVGTTLLFTSALFDHYSAKRAKLKNPDKTKEEPSTKKLMSEKFELFTKNANEIKNNKWWFVLSGAISSMAVASLAAAPLVSMALQTTSSNQGNIISALIADTTWVIGFIPLVVLTALITGVYSPVGLTLVFVWGDIAKIIGAQIVAATGNENTYLIAIAIAGVMGGASLFAETYLIKGLAVVLLKVPGIQKISDSMRTGITKTINYAFLMGGVIAAFLMGQHVAGLIAAKSEALSSLAVWMPSMGAGIVILLVIVNSVTKKKMAAIAISPLGAIVVGVLYNVIWLLA